MERGDFAKSIPSEEPIRPFELVKTKKLNFKLSFQESERGDFPPKADQPLAENLRTAEVKK